VIVRLGAVMAFYRGVMHPRTRANLLILSNILIGTAFLALMIWACLFVIAMRFVTRAPTNESIAAHPFVIWSNHGVFHYVPLSDYQFYDVVMSTGPFLLIPTFFGMLLKHWLERLPIPPNQP